MLELCLMLLVTYLNQAGIISQGLLPTTCVVEVIELFVLVCLYCRTTTVLGCVVHDRAMFFKDVPPKTRLTDY